VERIFELSPIIPLLFALSILIVSLFFERLLFYRFQYTSSEAVNLEGWRRVAVNRKVASEKRLELFNNIEFMEGLVKVASLLGLLGTVIGIVALFETLQFQGSKDMLFYGVYRATVPTMIGISISIVGLFLLSILKREIAVRLKELQVEG
jgi:biopolymer transport protein ExbB